MADESKRGKKDDDQPDAARAAREAVKAADASEADDTYPSEWLIANAQSAVGYDAGSVAGALSAVRKKNLTIEEARSATKEWLKSPVKEG